MLDRLTVERIGAEARGGPILVGLSGGGDSTALLHLLCDQLGARRLHAAIVDHGLRVGSEADARQALALAQSLDVAAEVLTLVWADGANRAQQAARQARYQALSNAARSVGARVIALGHTVDDQAETVMMRAAAGSAWRGLAGIAPFAPAPIWPQGRGLWMARPLLHSRRAGLRLFLHERGATWIEDPANTNPNYTRVRVRERLARLEAAGFEPMHLVRIADGLRIHADALDAAARDLIAGAARFDADRIVIERKLWVGAADVRRRALSVLLTAAAGATREPQSQTVARLEVRLGEASFRGATLGGAVVSVRDAALLVARDPGALVGRADGAARVLPLPLPPGDETVWDGRLVFTMNEPGWSVCAETGGPILKRAEVQRSVVAAEGRWLVEARVGHLLGQLH